MGVWFEVWVTPLLDAVKNPTSQENQNKRLREMKFYRSRNPKYEIKNELNCLTILWIFQTYILGRKEYINSMCNLRLHSINR